MFISTKAGHHYVLWDSHALRFASPYCRNRHRVGGGNYGIRLRFNEVILDRLENNFEKLATNPTEPSLEIPSLCALTLGL